MVLLLIAKFPIRFEMPPPTVAAPFPPMVLLLMTVSTLPLWKKMPPPFAARFPLMVLLSIVSGP